jgi:hypothetical protein
MKECTNCKELKSESEFPYNKNTIDRCHSYCSKCKSKKDAESRRKRTEKKRNRKKFGIEATDRDIQNLINNGAIKQ